MLEMLLEFADGGEGGADGGASFEGGVPLDVDGVELEDGVLVAAVFASSSAPASSWGGGGQGSDLLGLREWRTDSAKQVMVLSRFCMELTAESRRRVHTVVRAAPARKRLAARSGPACLEGASGSRRRQEAKATAVV